MVLNGLLQLRLLLKKELSLCRILSNMSKRMEVKLIWLFRQISKTIKMINKKVLITMKEEKINNDIKFMKVVEIIIIKFQSN